MQHENPECSGGLAEHSAGLLWAAFGAVEQAPSQASIWVTLSCLSAHRSDLTLNTRQCRYLSADQILEMLGVPRCLLCAT